MSIWAGTAAVVALACPCAGAQRVTAVRQVGALQRMSADSLASAATALPMPGGRVLVNDVVGRRVLLFDSTLAHPTVVADTTTATANAYGRGGGTLIRYRGDSALFIAPSSLSMLVIAPGGTIARVMAIPRPDDAQALLAIYGVPGFDARGRLVYFGGRSLLPSILMLRKGRPLPPIPGFAARLGADGPVDSSFIARVDPATRVVDTAAWVRIPKGKRQLKTDAQGLLQSIETTPDPLPLVDAWTVMPDGSIAIVRGRDYHVDWLDGDGRLSSTPKMPFDWTKVSDERKQTLIDSTVKAWQTDFTDVEAGGGGGGAGSGGRGGGATPPPATTSGGQGSNLASMIAVPPPLSDLPDYFPPFTQEGNPPPLHADADGNLWIRTTTVLDGRPVYDVVNRRGERVDRLQLPAFRTIAGFAPGVVFMAVKDKSGVVHLERARIK